jgi:hypothetical protein
MVGCFICFAFIQMFTAQILKISVLIGWGKRAKVSY